MLCAKGAAGIMQHLSPARLRAPLRRIGPRGSGEFREIAWDEALGIARNWLAPIREKHPEQLAFFTGRDQSQALTGWWAQQFGTPNYAAHGGFCSVNMAAAGIYTLGGSFWEFGAPDWERTELLLLFGVAEDHDCNPMKIGLGKLKARGARVVAINPVRTGYSAIADQLDRHHPGHRRPAAPQPRPPADDAPARSTSTTSCATPTPRTSSTRTRARRASAASCATATAASSSGTAPATAPSPRRRPVAKPALSGTFNVGPTHAKPVFQLMAEAYLDPALAPEAVAPACGVDAATIRRLAAELADTAFEQPDHPRPPLDRLPRRAARDDDRPPGRHARHARHLGAFQRLPDLPRASTCCS